MKEKIRLQYNPMLIAKNRYAHNDPFLRRALPTVGYAQIDITKMTGTTIKNSTDHIIFRIRIRSIRNPTRAITVAPVKATETGIIGL